MTKQWDRRDIISDKNAVTPRCLDNDCSTDISALELKVERHLTALQTKFLFYVTLKSVLLPNVHLSVRKGVGGMS